MADRVDKAECRLLRAQGWTLDHLAARYRVSKPAVSKVCRGVACPADHDERVAAEAVRRTVEAGEARRAQFCALREAGKIPKVIAFDLGLSIGCVYSHLQAARAVTAAGHAPREATACR